MSVSILEVAKYAGVSKSTVSRVLTGGSVSEKAEKAVRQAILELDYHPNGIARGLRGASSRVIGVVSDDRNVFLTRSMTTRLAGMNSVFSKAGYSLLVINADQEGKKQELEKGVHFLEEKRVDGLILLGDIDDERQLGYLDRFRPIVYTGERVNADRGFRVYMGNYQYSRDAYSYLMANGHRRIVTVMICRSSQKMKMRRWAAWQEMCRVFSVVPQEDDFLNLCENSGDMTEKLNFVYEVFRKKRATAFFVDSIEFANSMVNFFQRIGLELRKDYSVVAVERGATEETKDALITAVTLPDYEYGIRCGELMLEVLRDSRLNYRDVSIPYTFEVRHSVRNLPQP